MAPLRVLGYINARSRSRNRNRILSCTGIAYRAVLLCFVINSILKIQYSEYCVATCYRSYPSGYYSVLTLLSTESETVESWYVLLTARELGLMRI